MSMHGLPEFSASAWQVFGVPLVNHLWQSTLFAAVAGLLTLLLKTNQAQARYCVWLVASIKFLLPFSLLASLGSLLSPAVPSGAIRYVLIIEEIGQPFAPLHATQAAPATLAVLARFLPALLLAGWFCGFTAVLLFWRRRWQRLRTAIHRAAPLDSGRELEMLRRLEQAAGRPVKIRLMVSEAALEPGIVGVFRPVMLLPEGISGRLSDAQLEAVMTHELCHVRRRDNLAAALHMLVEALFWFHPLVWWIGARLVAERERACDDEVLRP